MVFLQKIISQIFLIDFFTELERQSSTNGVTLKLCTYLNSKGIQTTCFFPNNEAEVLASLNSILNRNDLGLGVIIHFIGHGDKGIIGFGNSNFYVPWPEIKDQLIQINNTTNNGLIINTSIMCYGYGIFELIKEDNPFYAGIGSLTISSLQGVDHNIQLYGACLTRDDAERKFHFINNLIEESQKVRAYQLKYA